MPFGLWLPSRRMRKADGASNGRCCLKFIGALRWYDFPVPPPDIYRAQIRLCRLWYTRWMLPGAARDHFQRSFSDKVLEDLPSDVRMSSPPLAAVGLVFLWQPVGIFVLVPRRPA